MLLGGAGLVAALIALALVVWRFVHPVKPWCLRTGGSDAGAAVVAPPPIRVGVLNSLSGTMAVSTRPIVEATLLAIDEINAQGGLLGRRVVQFASMVDPTTTRLRSRQSGSSKREKVVTIFGGWTPSDRRAMKPLLEKYDHLLIFPARDEEWKTRTTSFYLGSTPYQQVIPRRWSAR